MRGAGGCLLDFLSFIEAENSGVIGTETGQMLSVRLSQFY